MLNELMGTSFKYLLKQVGSRHIRTERQTGIQTGNWHIVTCICFVGFVCKGK